MSNDAKTIADLTRLSLRGVRIALTLLAPTPVAWCWPDRGLEAVARAIMRLRAGVPPIPIFTTRERDGRFTVTVEEPLGY